MFLSHLFVFLFFVLWGLIFFFFLLVFFWFSFFFLVLFFSFFLFLIFGFSFFFFSFCCWVPQQTILSLSVFLFGSLFVCYPFVSNLVAVFCVVLISAYQTQFCDISFFWVFGTIFHFDQTHFHKIKNIYFTISKVKPNSL